MAPEKNAGRLSAVGPSWHGLKGNAQVARVSQGGGADGTSLMSSPAFFALSIWGDCRASHPVPFMPIKSAL